MNIKSSEVVFFLGAGASVAAGVPDTYAFVKEYLDSLQEAEKKRTIEEIIRTLKQWKGTEIDIELLLETLTKLKDKDLDPVLQFYPRKDFSLSGYDEKEPLIDSLKDFIKTKGIVSEEKVQYLQPLLAFIEETPPLDIISVNYDTSIEQFCNIHKLTYQDGFEVHWNPKSFHKDHTEIRLYKLHGSVMWYQTDRGDYIKLPVMTGESKIQLITGEKAENLMLYPMQKWDYAEPFLELSVEIKRLLESDACKFLIVAGYSFRDEHIIRILWDSARKNRNLRVILIDPKAYNIYCEKLKFYDRNFTNPSSLSGKVICLPYLFEKVLPSLKNYYLQSLKEGLSCENAQHQIEIQGKPPTWVFCIEQLINAEYIEKAEELLKRIFLIDRDFAKQCIGFPLRIGMNLSLGGEEERAIEYFDMFNEQIAKVVVKKLHVSVDVAQRQGSAEEFPKYQIVLDFNYQINNQRGGSYIGGEDFIAFIKAQVDYCQSRIEFSSREAGNFLKVFKKINDLEEYFNQFPNGKIEFEQYVQLRKEKRSQLEEIKTSLSHIKQKGFPYEEFQKVGISIEEIEREILTKILERK